LGSRLMKRLPRSKPRTSLTGQGFGGKQNFCPLHLRPQDRAFWVRGKERTRICVSIVEKTVEKALQAIEEANYLADLIELRVDYLKEPELVSFMKKRKKPFIITNRRKEEGGRYRGDEKERFRILKEAVGLGAEYVDVEIRSRRSLLRDLIANKKRTKMVLSFHDFQKTPSQKELQGLCDRMSQLGADVVKIVTFATSWEDNLQVLSLIPFARKKNQEIVTFCMGEKGKMSRLFAPFIGTAWIYAPFSRAKASAPGQLTVGEMKEIWEKLKI
jgi:3-dehydroquinate dehydratase type I